MHLRQRFGLLDLTRVVHELESKQILDCPYKVLAVVEYVRMHFEDRCRIDRERAVDVDRYRRNRSRPREHVEIVDQLLSASNRKGWNENAAATPSCISDDGSQPGTCPFCRLVGTVAIGRLHQHHISSLRRLRVTNDRQP